MSGRSRWRTSIIAVVAMAILFVFLTLTITGKAMRAVADNPMLAD